MPLWAGIFMEHAQVVLHFDTPREVGERWNWRMPDRNQVRAIKELAYTHFSDKLVTVTTAAEVRQLRTVRARRDR